MRTRTFQRLAVKPWLTGLSKRLPIPRRWAIALAIIVCLLIIGSYSLGQWLTPTAVISPKTVSDLKEVPLLMRHESPVLSVALTTAPQQPLSLVSTDQDRIIKLWHVNDDPSQSKSVSEIFAISAQVDLAAVNPNGQSLATISSHDSKITANLWDLTQITPDFRAFTHDRKVLAVSFSPDNQVVATGDQTGVIHLWDLNTGKVVTTLKSHEDEVIALAFTPDGSRLASGGSDGLIYLWDWQAAKLVKQIEANDIVASIAFSPDGKILAASGRPPSVDVSEKIQLWDVTTGKVLSELNGFAPVAFSPDGKLLAGSTQTDEGMQQVTVWSVTAPAQPVVLTQGLYPFVFTPDGQGIVSDSAGGKIKVWNPQNTSLVNSFQGRQKFTSFMAVQPQAGIFVGGTDDKINLWTLGGAKLFSFHLNGINRYSNFTRSLPLFHAMALSPDGQTLAVAIANTIELIPLNYLSKRQQVVNARLEQPRLITFNPTDQNLILVDIDRITILRPKDSHVIRTLTVDLPEDFHIFALSPDGKTLAGAGTGGLIQLWNLQTGKVVEQFQEDERSTILSLAFSPNGRRLASGSWSEQVKVWDLRKRELALSMDSDRVFSLAFSPAGDLLASGRQTGEIQLWDSDTGVKLRTLVGHAGGIQALAFSGDGALLASSSEDKTIKLWRVSRD